MSFVLNVVLTSILISLSVWMANKFPKQAGFVLAIPLSTFIAFALVHSQYNDIDKTMLIAKSTFISFVINLSIFIPYFLLPKFRYGFWTAYGFSFLIALLAYPIHRLIYKALFD